MSLIKIITIRLTKIHHWSNNNRYKNSNLYRKIITSEINHKFHPNNDYRQSQIFNNNHNAIY